MKKRMIILTTILMISVAGCGVKPENNILFDTTTNSISGTINVKILDKITEDSASEILENLTTSEATKEETKPEGKVIAQRNAAEAKKEKEEAERKQREAEEKQRLKEEAQKKAAEEATKKTEKETSKSDDKITSKEENTLISNKDDKETNIPENNTNDKSENKKPNTQTNNVSKTQVNNGNIVSGKRIISGLQVNELNSKLSGYAGEIISLIQNSSESEVTLNFDWTFDEYKTVIQAIKNTYFSYCGTISTSYTAFDGEVYKLQIGLSREYFNKNREIESCIKSAISGTTGMTEKDAATVINNYVCSKINYDIGKNTLETAFLEGKGNCLSYALMYKEICNYIGIQCEIIKDAGENHVWNKVLLGGTWYYIDTCWNDSSNNGVCQKICVSKLSENFL